jgi:hypothetical protein
VVALAGDHLDIVSPVDLATQIVALRASLAGIATRTKLLVASGNHDLNTRNVAGEKTSDWLAPLRDAGAAVDGDTIEVAGTYWTVLEWWDGPHARAEVEAQLAAAAGTVGRATLAVGVPLPAARPAGLDRDPPLRRSGRRRVDRAMATDRGPDRPHPPGAVHPQGAWAERLGGTWLFNAGKQPGPTPSHVEIDLARGIARWVSYQGVEERELTGDDGPLDRRVGSPGRRRAARRFSSRGRRPARSRLRSHAVAWRSARSARCPSSTGGRRDRRTAA